jgi:hypothetical protein
MRTPRTITAALAALLGAVALAGPAAADSPSGQQAKANVYVPPAVTSGDTGRANVYVPPAVTSGATGRANVYVPPVTKSGATGSGKANVYVPPNPQPIHQHATASASAGDFDWGSAAIGAAVAIGASLIALGGAAGLRRRHQMQPALTG